MNETIPGTLEETQECTEKLLELPKHTFFSPQLNILVGELKERLILVILESEAWTVNTRNISNHNLKYKKMVN